MSDNIFYDQQNGGYLVATREELDRLNKALTAGYGYSGQPSQFSGGTPLMVESLEASLKSTTWQMQNLVLWPAMPMDRASNTVEQYTRVTGYGSNGSPYFTEGGSPPEEDSRYNREIQRVVYFGTRRRVSHPMMLVKVNFGDAVAREINSGNMWLLKNIERELYKGNANFILNGEDDGAASGIPSDSLAINGLEQQIRSGDTDSKSTANEFVEYGGFDSVVRDLNDGPLTEDELEEGAVSILNNFGIPTDLHMDPRTLSELSRQFFPKERVHPMGVPNGQAGFVLQSFASSGGTFKLRANVFLNQKTNPPPVNQRNNVPTSPSISGVAIDTVNFDSGFAGGEVFNYRVTAVNEMGESQASASSVSPAVTSAGDAVNVTIDNTSAAGAKYYGIYRSNDAGAAGTEQFIGWAKRSPGASTVFKDKNRKLPGRSTAYLMFLDADAMQFKQLAPLSKINLATVAASLEWLQVLYGALLVYTPRKHFLYENVGRAS